ncbi:sigma factor [Streptomyces albulus]|nr:sigma factor [Streptomyces noursei]
MGVDGRDERRGESAGRPPEQVPGQTGPLGRRRRPAAWRCRAQRAGAASALRAQPPSDAADDTAATDADAQPASSDAELVAAMRAGDDSAYEELYRRHAEAVRRHARSCCRDAHTAEDLTGEVFARTLQAVRAGPGRIRRCAPIC